LLLKSNKKRLRFKTASVLLAEKSENEMNSVKTPSPNGQFGKMAAVSPQTIL
jgi:hypothetical protein